MPLKKIKLKKPSGNHGVEYEFSGPDLSEATLEEQQVLGSGAGGDVYRYRYLGHSDPDQDRMLRSLCYHYKASDGQTFSYLGVKKVRNEDGNKTIDEIIIDETRIANALSDPSGQGQITPTSQRFNKGHGAVFGGEPVIVTQIETSHVEEITDPSGKVTGIKFKIGGDLKNHFQELNQHLAEWRTETPRQQGFKTAYTTDFDITLSQVIGSAYQGMQAMHNQSIFHCDLSLRNILLSETIDKVSNNQSYSESIPIGFTAKVNDYGYSIVSSNINTLMEDPRISGPLRWMDSNRVKNKISVHSDLYAYRMTMLEGLATLMSGNNEENFYKMQSRDTNGKPLITPVDVAVFVRGNGNHSALLAFVKNAEQLVDTPESQCFLECFKAYLAPQNFDKLTREQDAALLAEGYNKYFQKILGVKLSNLKDSNDYPSFLISINRLLQMPVSESFKNSELYKNCKKLESHSLQVAAPSSALMDDIENLKYVVDPKIQTPKSETRQDTRFIQATLSDGSDYAKLRARGNTGYGPILGPQQDDGATASIIEPLAVVLGKQNNKEGRPNQALLEAQKQKINLASDLLNTHIDDVFSNDISLALRLKNMLVIIANYGVKQRSDHIGVSRRDNVLDILTSLREKSTAEEMITYLDTKLAEKEIHQHYHFRGDTTLVKHIKQVQEVLGKSPIVEEKKETMLSKVATRVMPKKTTPEEELEKIFKLLDKMQQDVKALQREIDRYAASQPEEDRRPVVKP